MKCKDTQINKRDILSIFLLLLVHIQLYATNPNDTVILKKESFVYNIKGNDTLLLDKYLPTNVLFEKSPCVIFMFGGGFSSGERDKYIYMPYFKFLTDNGYAVISIDYRLGFKSLTVDDGEKMTAKKFITLFKNTINMAVEDLFDATNFTLQHCEKWNIDPALIVASGASAGAISVLHGEYEISSRSVLSQKLPRGFNYAGIVSFAGAILSTEGILKWSENSAPIQLFHGDADKNVPYNKLKIGKIGFFGSKSIAKQMYKSSLPYYFYTEINADHRIYITPTYQNQEEILSFLNDYVINKQRLSTTVIVRMSGQAKVKKNFSIFDYVKTNYLGE